VSIDSDAVAQGGVQVVRSSDDQNCFQLSERVIALRRAGFLVALVTGHR